MQTCEACLSAQCKSQSVCLAADLCLNLSPRVSDCVGIPCNITNTENSFVRTENFDLYNVSQNFQNLGLTDILSAEYLHCDISTKQTNKGIHKRAEQIKLNWVTDAGLTFIHTPTHQLVEFPSLDGRVGRVPHPPFDLLLQSKLVTLGDLAHFTPWPNYSQRVEYDNRPHLYHR